MREWPFPQPNRTWFRRAWQTRRAVLGRLAWVVVLFLATLLMHLHLANQAVSLWDRIRTLREENWQLWWEIQTLYGQLAQRDAQAMAAHWLPDAETWPQVKRPAVSAWRWPDPLEVLYVPAPLGPTPVPQGVTLPPLSQSAAEVLPEAYTRSLWDVLRTSRWCQQVLGPWLGVSCKTAQGEVPR